MASTITLQEFFNNYRINISSPSNNIYTTDSSFNQFYYEKAYQTHLFEVEPGSSNLTKHYFALTFRNLSQDHKEIFTNKLSGKHSSETSTKILLTTLKISHPIQFPKIFGVLDLYGTTVAVNNGTIKSETNYLAYNSSAQNITTLDINNLRVKLETSADQANMLNFHQVQHGLGFKTTKSATVTGDRYIWFTGSDNQYTEPETNPDDGLVCIKKEGSNYYILGSINEYEPTSYFGFDVATKNKYFTEYDGSIVAPSTQPVKIKRSGNDYTIICGNYSEYRR